MADRERIALGRVVFHDDAEILHHQEARPLGAGRRQQKSLVVRMSERLVVGAPHAAMLPLREYLRLGAVGEDVVETLWHRDLVAPTRAGLPAVLLQIVRGGRDEVGGIV